MSRSASPIVLLRTPPSQVTRVFALSSIAAIHGTIGTCPYLSLVPGRYRRVFIHDTCLARCTAPHPVASLAGVTSIRSSIMHISNFVNTHVSRTLTYRPLTKCRDLWTTARGCCRLQVLDVNVVSQTSSAFVCLIDRSFATTHRSFTVSFRC
jgi:hypothetical protein